jgi:hypothetical protein
MAYHTKFDAIVAAMVTALKGNTSLAGVTITDETTFEELPTGINEAIRVTLLESLPLNRAYGGVDWSSTVRLACMARSDKAGVDGRSSSRLGAQAYLTLMAAPTLGGLAIGIDEPRIQPDMNFYTTRTGTLNLDFPVKHRTTGRVLT